MVVVVVVVVAPHNDDVVGVVVQEPNERDEDRSATEQTPPRLVVSYRPLLSSSPRPLSSPVNL